MTKVSVVVPCYNVEQYVKKCLDSLINQTLHDIEIICIDDKSTDNTLKILQDYAKQDKRIKLFTHSKNQGVSIARNLGIKHATGQYLGFVDPDDWVDLDFYEKLYTRAKETNADIVQGNVMITNAKNNITSVAKFNYPKNKLYSFSTAFWSAIYKHSMITKHKIFFPSGIITAQDSTFLTQITICAKNIFDVPDTYYHYLYQRVDSLDSCYLSHKKAKSKINAFRLNLKYICNANLDKNSFCKYIGNHVINHALYEITKQYEKIDDQREMFNFLVNIRNGYNIREYFDYIVPKRFKSAFKTNNFSKYAYVFSTTRKRIYLFEILPLLLIEKYKSITKYKLFDFFTLVKIQNNKMYLFSFLPFLKLRG